MPFFTVTSLSGPVQGFISFKMIMQPPVVFFSELRGLSCLSKLFLASNSISRNTFCLNLHAVFLGTSVGSYKSNYCSLAAKNSRVYQSFLSSSFYVSLLPGLGCGASHSFENIDGSILSLISELSVANFQSVSSSGAKGSLIRSAIIFNLGLLFPEVALSSLSSFYGGSCFTEKASILRFPGGDKELVNSWEISEGFYDLDTRICLSILGSRIKDPLFLGLLAECLEKGWVLQGDSFYKLLKGLDSENPLLYLKELYFLKADSFISLEVGSEGFICFRYSGLVFSLVSSQATGDILLKLSSLFEGTLRVFYSFPIPSKKTFMDLVIWPALVSSVGNSRSVRLEVSPSSLVKLLGSVGCCDYEGKPTPLFRLYSLTPGEIVSWYNSFYIGLKQHYQGFDNSSYLLKISHRVLWGSCARLLAAKLKLGTVSAVCGSIGSRFMGGGISEGFVAR